MVIYNKYKDELLTLKNIDSNDQIEIYTFSEKDLSIWINKEQAEQIVNHLKEQFGL